MLLLLGLCLASVFYFAVNHNIRYRKRRKRAGLLLIVIGASATVAFDQRFHDFYVWGFVLVWGTGLELWFNCEKYGGTYPQRKD